MNSLIYKIIFIKDFSEHLKHIHFSLRQWVCLLSRILKICSVFHGIKRGWRRLSMKVCLKHPCRWCVLVFTWHTACTHGDSSYHITSYSTTELKTMSLTENLSLSRAFLFSFLSFLFFFFFWSLCIWLNYRNGHNGHIWNKTDTIAHIGYSPLVLCKSPPNLTLACQWI